MKLRFFACIMIVLFSSLVIFDPDSTGQIQANKNDERLKATVCQIKKDPAAYNHKLVEVTGFISHGFEDFGLFDIACPSWPDIWLEYGGISASNTMYCCGLTPGHKRSKPLVVEDISIELIADNRFKQFDTLLNRVPDTVVHATVVGRFFAGEKIEHRGGRWGGYGHMGCCTLLAIQQVVSVDPHTSRELDYRASPDQPDEDRVGCGYSDLTELDPTTDIIKAQEKADSGEDDWVFSDPKRVAASGLAKLLTVEENSINLRLTRRAQGRMIYEWRPKRKGDSYMVVVSRPYIASFIAKDPNRVTWVVIAAYEVGCDENKAVRRIN